MRTVFYAVLVAFALPALASAQTLTLVQQGMLLDGADNPVNRTVQLKFTLYKNAAPPPSSTDATWWASNAVNVPVANGLYSVVLGQFSSGTGELPLAAFEGPGERWLGVEVDGSAMLPRLLLGTVPYAFYAKHAELAELATTADALGDACVGCLKTAALGAGQVTLEKLALGAGGRMTGLGADTLDGLDSVDLAAAGHTHDDRYLRKDTAGALTAPLTLSGPPTDALHAATKGYVDTVDARFGEVLRKDGSVALTGALTLSGPPTAANHAATKGYVDNATPNLTGYLKADGTISMTGALTLAGAPTASNQAATKAYVDSALAAFARKDGTLQAGGLLDFGANGQLRLGTGGTLVIDGVTLDAALLQKLKDITTVVAQTQADARPSCAAIKAANPFSANGAYFIDPNSGSTSDAFRVYCDLTAADGPWTLVVRLKKSEGQAHWSSGVVGASYPDFKGANTRKFSDATINAIRAAGTYSGSTGYKFTCFEDNTSTSGCSQQTMYCSRSCSFNAIDSVNTSECSRCTKSYEGALTQLAPNTGTRGMGHHHLDANWFAYQRHPEEGTNSGCRSDACGGGDGTLWVK